MFLVLHQIDTLLCKVGDDIILVKLKKNIYSKVLNIN